MTNWFSQAGSGDVTPAPGAALTPRRESVSCYTCCHLSRSLIHLDESRCPKHGVFCGMDFLWANTFTGVERVIELHASRVRREIYKMAREPDESYLQWCDENLH